MAAALRIQAGPTARRLLRERGLLAADVRVIPAAAGGPKGLVLNGLDRFLFGHWLRDVAQPVHLVGASIGAWRMASACLQDADTGLQAMAEAYVTQHYPHAPGRPPRAADVSAIFGDILRQHLQAHGGQLLSHPTRRLHVVASRGRHVLAREGRLRTPIGYAGAALCNAVHRAGLGLWLERVVLGDPRDPLPLPLDDLPTRHVPLNANNLTQAVLASCSIPFWLEAVREIEGAPAGAYWDGGITDYHLHWNYGALMDGLALYPHFQTQVVPGWLDKGLRRRHRATAFLDRLVLLSPDPAWVAARLPGGRLPDRNDFKTFADDPAGRQRAWRRAIAESRQLADEFANLVGRAGAWDVEPLG